MSNVHEMKTDPDKVRGSLEMVKRNLDAMIEYQQVLATIRRKAYLAHIDERFTPAQALELVQKLF